MAGTVILACPTLGVELKEAMKEENSRAVVYFMPPGLHRDPKALHHYVQNAVDHFYNVDRIVVCTTGCGGGNIGIKATTAPLIYPKTRDCLDILLSGDSLKDLKRDMMGVFLTEGWMEFMKESDIDFDKLKQKMGETKARMYLISSDWWKESFISYPDITAFSARWQESSLTTISLLSPWEKR